MQALAAIYNAYALLNGMTSYRLVNGKLHQTRVTRIYALVANVIYLAVLPICLWKDAIFISTIDTLPKFIRTSPFALHFVTYLVIFLIFTSRCCGEEEFLDCQRLNTQLNRKINRSGKKTSSLLCRIFFLKAFLVAFQWLVHFLAIFVFWLWIHNDIPMLFRDLLITTAFNTMVMRSYIYFLTFWNIARGYEFVNQRMDELIPTLKPHTSRESAEIYHLWAMHAHLGRIARRVQRKSGLRMLGIRLDYFMRSIIHGFNCIVLLINDTRSVPQAVKYYITIMCCMHSLGFFLNDYLIDLTTEYQSKPKDFIIEGIMTKELSAYIIYERSMTLNLKFCGLYISNRHNFLQMLEGILGFFILLLQFFLI